MQLLPVQWFSVRHVSVQPDLSKAKLNKTDSGVDLSAAGLNAADLARAVFAFPMRYWSLYWSHALPGGEGIKEVEREGLGAAVLTDG